MPMTDRERRGYENAIRELLRHVERMAAKSRQFRQTCHANKTASPVTDGRLAALEGLRDHLTEVLESIPNKEAAPEQSTVEYLQHCNRCRRRMTHRNGQCLECAGETRP